MRMGLAGGVVAILLLAAIIVGYSTFFTVYQTQQALVVRLGQPVRVITEPGLNAKIPFIDSVIYIDKRILDLETPAQEVIASADQTPASPSRERLVVDAFARYRIDDPLKFYQTVGPDGANSQLAILLNSALRRVLGEATLSDVVRDKRDELMARMRDQLDHEAQPFGIQVVDVRIRRADLPEQNSQAVYQRMQTERQREAAEFRAQGSQKSQEIRARADRDVTVLVADATSKSEQIRGEGDAERNRIFAEAYQPGSGFLRLLPLDAGLRGSLKHGDTRLLLQPDSDFFRYFDDPSGKSLPGGTNTQAAAPSGLRGAIPPSAGSQRYRVWRPGDVRFPGRARLVLRDRGHLSCRVSGQRQAGDGDRDGNARRPVADRRHRFGGGRRADRLAGARLSGPVCGPLFRPNPVPNGRAGCGYGLAPGARRGHFSLKLSPLAGALTSMPPLHLSPFSQFVRHGAAVAALRRPSSCYRRCRRRRAGPITSPTWPSR